MDSTCEDTQELTKSTKSSILKPTVPRIPLQDVNMRDYCVDDDLTDQRKRRVSFTSVKKIKEFDRKAESIVVCETPAYDEEFTLSEESGQINKILNEVTDGRITPSSGGFAVIGSPVSRESSDMELDTIADKIQINPSYVNPIPVSDNINYEDVDMSIITELLPEIKKTSIGTTFSERHQSMEYTCLAPQTAFQPRNVSPSASPTRYVEESSDKMLQFTCIAPPNSEHFQTENLVLHEESLEFTAIPPQNSLHHQQSPAPSIRSQQSLEFTCHPPHISVLGSERTERNPNSGLRKSIALVNQSMEFTCPIPNLVAIKDVDSTCISLDKTIISEPRISPHAIQSNPLSLDPRDAVNNCVQAGYKISVPPCSEVGTDIFQTSLDLTTNNRDDVESIPEVDENIPPPEVVRSPIKLCDTGAALSMNETNVTSLINLSPITIYCKDMSSMGKSNFNYMSGINPLPQMLSCCDINSPAYKRTKVSLGRTDKTVMDESISVDVKKEFRQKFEPFRKSVTAFKAIVADENTNQSIKSDNDESNTHLHQIEIDDGLREPISGLTLQPKEISLPFQEKIELTHSSNLEYFKMEGGFGSNTVPKISLPLFPDQSMSLNSSDLCSAIICSSDDGRNSLRPEDASPVLETSVVKSNEENNKIGESLDVNSALIYSSAKGRKSQRFETYEAKINEVNEKVDETFNVHSAVIYSSVDSRKSLKPNDVSEISKIINNEENEIVDETLDAHSAVIYPSANGRKPLLSETCETKHNEVNGRVDETLDVQSDICSSDDVRISLKPDNVCPVLDTSVTKNTEVGEMVNETVDLCPAVPSDHCRKSLNPHNVGSVLETSVTGTNEICGMDDKTLAVCSSDNGRKYLKLDNVCPVLDSSVTKNTEFGEKVNETVDLCSFVISLSDDCKKTLIPNNDGPVLETSVIRTNEVHGMDDRTLIACSSDNGRKSLKPDVCRRTSLAQDNQENEKSLNRNSIFCSENKASIYESENLIDDFHCENPIPPPDICNDSTEQEYSIDCDVEMKVIEDPISETEIKDSIPVSQLKTLCNIPNMSNSCKSSSSPLDYEKDAMDTDMPMISEAKASITVSISDASDLMESASENYCTPERMSNNFEDNQVSCSPNGNNSMKLSSCFSSDMKFETKDDQSRRKEINYSGNVKRLPTLECLGIYKESAITDTKQRGLSYCPTEGPKLRNASSGFSQHPVLYVSPSKHTYLPPLNRDLLRARASLVKSKYVKRDMSGTMTKSLFSKTMADLGFTYSAFLGEDDRPQFWWFQGFFHNCINFFVQIDAPVDRDIIKTYSARIKIPIINSRLSCHHMLKKNDLEVECKVSYKLKKYFVETILSELNSSWLIENLKSFGDLQNVIKEIQDRVSKVSAYFDSFFRLRKFESFTFIESKFILEVININASAHFEVHIDFSNILKRNLNPLDITIFVIAGDVSLTVVRELFLRSNQTSELFPSFYTVLSDTKSLNYLKKY